MHPRSRPRPTAPPRLSRPRRACALASLLGLLLTSCKDSNEDATTTTTPPTAQPPAAIEVALPTIDLATEVPKDDPASDGWETEVLAAKAKKQLQTLGAVFFTNDDPASLLTPSFTCSPLIPSPLSRDFDDELVRADNE